MGVFNTRVIRWQSANIGYSQTPIALRFAVIRTAGYP